MKKINIAIIGAGISGLMLGCVLRKNLIDCTIFEKSNKITEHGAGISISPNGTMLLENIDVLDQLIKNSCSPISVCIREANGNLIKKIYNEDFGKILTTNRKELIKVLADKYYELGGEILFDHHLENYDQNNKVLTFTNCDQYQINHAVGCDGIKSIIRSQLFSSNKDPKYSGFSAWRGIGLSDSKHINLYLNSNSHLVCYPINNKLETSFIAVFKNNSANEETWRREGSHEELSQDLNMYDPFIQSIFKSAKKVFKWGMYFRPPLKSIIGKNVSLLGDAAHPMLPFLAQGGNMALEDSYIFGNLCKKYFNDFDKVQKEYERLRLKRVTTIQTASERQSMIYHISNPLFIYSRNFLLKNTNIAKSRLQRIYDYNAMSELNKF